MKEDPKPSDPRTQLAAWYLRPGLRRALLVPITEALAVLTLLLLLSSSAGDPQANLQASTNALVALQPAPVAKEENAAQDYKLAFSSEVAHTQFMTGEEYGALANGSAAEYEHSSTKLFLSANSAAIKAAVTATARAQCNFELNYADGMTMKMTHLGPLRNLARLLAIDARMKAHEGDHAGAAASLTAIYKLAQHAGSDSVTISGLVMLACAGIADQALDDIVCNYTPSQPADIAAYRNAVWKNRNARQRMLNCMKTEEQSCLQYMDRLAVNGVSMGTGVGSAVFNSNSYAALFYGADRNCCKAFFQDVQERGGQGELLTSERVQQIMTSHQSGPAVMTWMLVPSVSRTLVGGIRNDDAARLADTALAYLQYRAKHGRDAKSLEDLVPEFLPTVPEDGFHGHPFHLVSKPFGSETNHPRAAQAFGSKSVLWIYSEGEAGVDKGPDQTANDAFVIPPLQWDDSSTKSSPAKGGR